MLKTAKDYWDDLRKTWKNVNRKADETSVHDMRVASRRLGAALLLLESAAHTDLLSEAPRRVKRLMKKLGPLRDAQVQISIVGTWKRRGNFEKFKSLLRRREQKHRASVRQYLNARRREKIQRALKDFEREAAKRLKDVPSEIVTSRIQNAIEVQRNEVKVAQDKLTRSNPQSLHTLRRSARRLRYSLEAARMVMGAAPEAELKHLRQVQTKLGDRRDRQLLNEELRKWRAQQ